MSPVELEGPSAPLRLEQITAEAVRIIDTAPEHGPYRPGVYAAALPPSAAELAALVGSQETMDLVARYHDADREAVRAQAWNNRLAETAAMTGFAAAVLVGAYLLLDVTLTPLSFGIGAIPFGVLAVALLTLAASFLVRPSRAWKARRLDAEVHRVNIFQRIVQPFASTDGLSLALRLEFFRRHLFEHQLTYFEKRCEDKQREAKIWKILGFFAGGLSVIGSSVPQAIVFIGTLGERHGWLYDLLRMVASLAPSDRRLYAFAWFFGFSLAALATLLPMIYKSSDLARMYRLEFRFLKRAGRDLPRARMAAAAGSGTSMYLFSQTVLNMLLLGAQEWASKDETPDPS
jgi:hypothetical protein